jgi:hypothetical protein
MDHFIPLSRSSNNVHCCPANERSHVGQLPVHDSGAAGNLTAGN